MRCSALLTNFTRSDLTDASKPSFNNLFHKHPASKIKEWLLTALQSQLTELMEHEVRALWEQCATMATQ